MIQTITIQVTPYVAADVYKIKQTAAQKMRIPIERIHDMRITKRSIDARSYNIKVNLELQCAIDQTKQLPKPHLFFKEQDVTHKPQVHIVGSGPAGLFAALRLIELGYKPILFERGKDVSARKRDVALLNRNESLHPDSNYCFGEGGAGTFSDGKLYTRSKKKGDNQRVLELFVLHGASPNILVDSHPHLGTDKLPDIITNIRNTICNLGGEIHFNAKITNITVRNNRITHIECNAMQIAVDTLILATGHSARDIYYMLHNKGIELEAKPCAMGVRAEHPQELIDRIQYHGNALDVLPAASYNLVHQVADRGVYSFCMCPGGIIVPSATDSEQIVVNGMSNSQRNSPFANSGIAVEMRVEDFADFAEYGVLAGLKYQEYLETLAFRNGGHNQIAPAQGIRDFIQKRLSKQLPECSYVPGVVSSPLHFWLPQHISERLREAFTAFDRKMKGYAGADGIIVGVESRTSSPVRIPRNPETFTHVRINNLYPCGEGSGYAGGIVSSAIDGINCAEKCVLTTNK
ncbi:MAG TPA: FAD-binding protein [Bacteroidales bacterium]|nr:FAD-binding protein [Bacteroidales bacterium]